MSLRYRAPSSWLAASLLAILILVSFNTSPAYADGAEVGKWATFTIDIYGYGPVEILYLKGPCDLWYSEPYPDPDDHVVIDTEIVAMELKNPEDVKVRKNPGLPSPGKTTGITPGIDFPAESFFDVYYEIELPGPFPGDTLVNYDSMHITSVIDQFPPYYETYIYPMGSPPIVLYNKGGIPVAAILEWREDILPWYEPKARITCPTAYKSEVAILNESGLIELPASLNGIDDSEIGVAEFSFRPYGSIDPFIPFYTDASGEGTRSSTIRPRGEGDGWCGYFEPGSEPFEGQVAEFKVEFFTPQFGPFADTVLVWVDPTPPIPEFTSETDSVHTYHIDSFFDVMYKVDDELTAPGPSELQAYPLVQLFERTLTPVDQLGLGTDLDTTSCGPASAASCLKYFADNGHPELDNPGGDEDKPDASAEDIARELQGAMGTNNDTGTSDAGMVSGIKSYLKGHGATGWTVSSHPVGSEADLAAMFREMEADSEDVMVCLEDTTTSGSGAGDTLSHWVTLGSREQIQHSPDSTSQKIDFMDPWGGGSTADNKYDVGKDENGNLTTEGYHLDAGGGSATIVGYVKVSPPEGGGGGGSGGSGGGSRSSLAPAFDPNWIPLDAGLVSGHGIVDTLRWDTHGFAPGLYLLEVITTNHQGHMCRDLRLCLLTDPSTDADPGTPGIKTGLHGTYPNPFNPTTTIVYSIERDGPVTLAIFDVAGRRVRTLMNDKFTEAGSYTVTWDGLDDRGKSVSSGVYFCRFFGAEKTSSTKMILLR